MLSLYLLIWNSITIQRGSFIILARWTASLSEWSAGLWVWLSFPSPSVPIAESGFFIFIFAPITSTRSLIVACEGSPGKNKNSQAGIPEDAQNVSLSSYDVE
jgi:hypothetical protein